jgi:hypothetical protein
MGGLDRGDGWFVMHADIIDGRQQRGKQMLIVRMLRHSSN